MPKGVLPSQYAANLDANHDTSRNRENVNAATTACASMNPSIGWSTSAQASGTAIAGA